MMRTFVRGGLVGLLLLSLGCQTMLTEKNLTVNGHFPVFGNKDIITQDHDDNEDAIKHETTKNYKPANFKFIFPEDYKGQIYLNFKNQPPMMTNSVRDARFAFTVYSWASLQYVIVYAYPEQLKLMTKGKSKLDSRVVYMAAFVPGPEPGTLVRLDRKKHRKVVLPTKRDEFFYKIGLKKLNDDPYKDQPIKLLPQTPDATP